jgi:hypothetical protein
MKPANPILKNAVALLLAMGMILSVSCSDGGGFSKLITAKDVVGSWIAKAKDGYKIINGEKDPFSEIFEEDDEEGKITFSDDGSFYLGNDSDNGGTYTITSDNGMILTHEVDGEKTTTEAKVTNFKKEEMTLEVTERIDSKNETHTKTTYAKIGGGGAIEEPITSAKGVTINGVVWATHNVSKAGGSFVAKPEDYGGYFRYYDLFEEWNYSDTRTPKPKLAKTIPSGWRMPTEDDLAKLFDAPYTWTSKNGVNGMVFGAPPNTIFLPAAGLIWAIGPGTPERQGDMGAYLTSTADNADASGLRFPNDGTMQWDAWISPNFNEFNSYPIRCVKN